MNTLCDFTIFWNKDIMEMPAQRHITQHKRFVPKGAYPNFCFAKTSFMLETLGDIAIKT